MTRHLRIGTRGSPLARAQAEWVRDRLIAQLPDVTADLIFIRTSGDRFAQQSLSAIGGKGLFVKEIEEALLAGTIDCAVHSMKDLPAELARGLVIAAVPEREDPRDVLVSGSGSDLAGLPSGARVGTSSLRRAALARALRPDLVVVPLRGNVDTRLRKLAAGEIDALLLASAGLRRLHITPTSAQLLPAEDFVPAIGQGALAIESRSGELSTLLHPLEHDETRRCVDAERAFLHALGGDCTTPLAAHAAVRAERLSLHGLIAQPDGKRIVRGERSGRVDEAVAIGHALGQELLGRGGAEILRALETAS